MERGVGEGGEGGRGASRKEKPARHKLQAVIFMMTDETGYWNPGEALGLRPPFAIPGHGRPGSGSPADLTPRRASAGPRYAVIRDKRDAWLAPPPRCGVEFLCPPSSFLIPPPTSTTSPRCSFLSLPPPFRPRIPRPPPPPLCFISSLFVVMSLVVPVARERAYRRGCCFGNRNAGRD